MAPVLWICRMRLTAVTPSYGGLLACPLSLLTLMMMSISNDQVIGFHLVDCGARLSVSLFSYVISTLVLHYVSDFNIITDPKATAQPINTIQKP